MRRAKTIHVSSSRSTRSIKADVLVNCARIGFKP
jgi:hypothetical protein